MKKDTSQQSVEQWEVGLRLEDLIRRGARDLIQKAIEVEVQHLLAEYENVRMRGGQRTVVRNGYLPAREVLTAVGNVEVRIPKVRDRSGGGVKFNSALAPPYMRRSARVSAALPWLYLKGISTGDMREALTVLLGDQAKGLSPDVVSRLKAQWATEYANWMKRNLAGSRYVYWWADGVHASLRGEDDARQCLLVIIGVRLDGTKELVAIGDGLRESKASWLELLRDLKARGLEIGPRLAVGDGALGFWGALDEIYPETRRQRCWVHKTAHVLNALPKSLQAKAKAQLHEIWMARRAPKRSPPLSGSCRLTKRNIRRLPTSSFPIATPCLRSTTFQRSTGFTCARPTRSSRPSRPCVTAPPAPRTALRARPSWAWPSSSSRRPRNPGDGFAALSALPN
jgi:transposase-like protein